MCKKQKKSNKEATLDSFPVAAQMIDGALQNVEMPLSSET